MSAQSRPTLETAVKDAWSRWLPTLVAIVSVAGGLFPVYKDYGKLEQRVSTVEARQTELIASIEKMNQNMIPRSEYLLNVARADENQKQMTAKLDRLLELVYATKAKMAE